ncbi:hypothetical protein E4U43_004455 [Claviceps pusilla]|uniref:Prenylated Rab acceptor 1 n=1 Tax=Claviceps pusilla TaxID=123648 RepID=A0A9P7N3X0_9HYPO|nr:hypothetical protein E4U43_004455 [Claviceps pusilla]
MARIQIPLDALTSRLSLGDRFSGFTSGPLSGRFSNLRPISEFLDFKRLSKPANFGEVQSRINYNLGHFSSNYAIVFVMLSLYALLTNWLLLFDITLVVVGMWFIGRLDGRDLEIGSIRATTSQLYTGLLVVAVPLCLIASPFSTLLWLIGASGVTILGHASFMDKPIDEAFSGEAGVGLAMRRNARFVSDSLNFTGIDLGDRSSGTYRRRRYSDSENDEERYGDSYSGESDGELDGEDEEDDGDDQDDDDGANGYLARLSPEEREEVLLRSALQLINRAQVMGATDVHLNKQELEAYGRYLQRMEDEERARQQKKKKRNTGSGSDKKKKKKSKEQRMAVPLTQLAPTSRKKKSSMASSTEFPPRQDSLPRQRSSIDLPPDGHDGKGYPPLGYFPPPPSSTPRSRPRSGTTTTTTTSSQRPLGRGREGHDYASRPSSASRPHSSRGSPRGETSNMSSRSPNNMNPFPFQTAGPRLAYSPGAGAASRRLVPGSSENMYEQRRETMACAADQSGHGSRRASYDECTSEEVGSSSEESTSDDRGNGAQVRVPVAKTGRRGRSEVIVVEESPERTKGKKKSSSSPVKRKPVGGKKKK